MARNPPGSEGLRNDFNRAEFEHAIEGHGHRLLWERAARCACRNNVDTSQPAVGCPECYGSGFEYHGELEIRGIVDALDLSADHMIAFGQWTFGSAKVTVRHEHRPDFHDRYTLLDSVHTFAEVRRRVGTRDRLRFPIATVHEDLQVANAAGDLVLRPQVPLNVSRLRLTDPTTLLPGAVLHPGEDFDVVDGKIDWRRGITRGTAPAVGQGYAVSYLHHPRYVVETFDHVVRDTRIKIATPDPGLQLRWTPQPVAVLCKLDQTDPAAGAGNGL